jgi:calcineurin-like phosphoesterase family protein
MLPHARYFAAVLVGLTTAACTDQVAPLPPMLPPADVITAGDPMIVAAGDLVCGTGTSSAAPCKDEETAALVTSIAPDAAILAGDIQYESGTYSDFNAFYDVTWGVHKAITWPAPGNHEYQTSGASGYFDYYNGVGVQTGRAGTRGKGYYSFNLGAWHIIALNSNCGSIGGCGAGSLQETWLRADLAANPVACTLAFWHHPLFSSGEHGNNSVMQALWQALYDHGADVVIAGHDHDYERFAPQTAAGIADAARGIRSFVVGTGGKENRPFSVVRANSELRNSNSLGLLRLTLHAASYDWQFMPIPGHTLNDAGSSSCVTSTPPPPPPGQTTLTISPSADAYTVKNTKNANFGTATTLLVDGSPEARTYLKFNVTGVGSKTIVSAKLRLFASDPSNEGGRLHRVTSTSWSEGNIKWTNQPTYAATVIGSVGAVTSGTWYEVDVKTVITADGTYSFALESSSTDGADYVSREGPMANRPQLVIVIQ